MNEYNYYLILPGTDYEKVTKDFIETSAAKWAEREAVMKKYGATRVLQNHSALLGFEYEDREKVPAGFHRNLKYGTNVYVPNKRSKEGKEAAKEMALPIPTSLEYHLTLCSNSGQKEWPTGIVQGPARGSGFRVRFCTFQQTKMKQLVLCVPTDGDGEKGWIPDLKQVKEIKPSQFFKLMGR
jgi:hypothetical protein